jgi:hypothetical protein
MAEKATAEVIDAAVESLIKRSLVIPTLEDNPYYSIRVRLDGLDYNLRFAWNERVERWNFDILTDDGKVLATGIRIVSNWPLLRYYQYDKLMPPGEMMAVDSTLDGSPPGFFDLAPGKRVQLIYFPVTDF